MRAPTPRLDKEGKMWLKERVIAELTVQSLMITRTSEEPDIQRGVLSVPWAALHMALDKGVTKLEIIVFGKGRWIVAIPILNMLTKANRVVWDEVLYCELPLRWEFFTRLHGPGN